jgi:hypothetical protein
VTDRLVDGSVVATVDDYPDAVGREELGDREADPAGAADDDRACCQLSAPA